MARHSTSLLLSTLLQRYTMLLTTQCEFCVIFCPNINSKSPRPCHSDNAHINWVVVHTSSHVVDDGVCHCQDLLSWDALWVDPVCSDDHYCPLIPPLFCSDLVC